MPADPALPPATRARRHWPRTTLRNYLVIIILAATVPLAFLTSFQIVDEAHHQRELLRVNLRDTARAVAVGIDREIVASIDALLVLGQSETLQRGEIASFERRLRGRGLLRPSWERIALLGPQGRLLFEVDAPGSAPGNTPGAGSSAAERAALYQVWQADAPGGSAVWSVVDTDSRAPSTWIGIHLRTPDGERYLLAARAGLAVWQSLLRGVAPEGDAYVTLFDARRRVLARTLGPEQFTGATLPPEAVAAMGSAPSGVQKTTLLGGGETYAAWQLLQHGGWGIGVGVPAAPFDQAQQRAVLLTVGVAAACLLLGVAAASMVAMRVTRPLRQLIERPADALNEPIAVTEIAQLRDAFQISELARGDASASLAKQAEEFETLFRTSPTGLAFAHDAECRRVLSNPAMAQIAPGLFDASPPEDGIEYFSAGRRLTHDELPLRRAARFAETVGETEVEIRAAGQPTRVVLASAVPLTDRDGVARGAIGVATDVTARKIAEGELADAMGREQLARRDAETANRAKDDLLAMLGHELRNPLNAIMTSVEVLRRADPHSALATSARAVVERQTRKLAGMVDELLDAGEIMADQVELSKRPVELAELVRAGVTAATPAAHERLQRLTIGTLASARAEADVRRIDQVLANLLDNALKYTPVGGEIGVELRTDGADAVLRVQDSGPGVAPALAAQMFEPFVQGHAGLARSAGGLGIGLTLVKRLVELHGGTVAMRSSSSGTLFEVRLPLARAAAPAESSAAHAATASARPAPRRIGVIDDNPDALTSMRSMLELAGHPVHTAADGIDGLHMLLTERPDIAIVDIGLPGIDGYEVARRSRAAGFRGRLIAMSGYGQPRDRERSLAEGFEDHLVKPVFPTRLLPLLLQD